MKRKITIQTVAEAAGVSSATVDRVLNSRFPVREATALRVISAAERVGYHAVGLMRKRLQDRAPVRQLAFCLQKGGDPFYRELGNALHEAARNNPQVACIATVHYMDALEPAAIAEQLLSAGRISDAVAVVAVDHPHVSAAIDTLHREGCPVFSILSDLSAEFRAGYVGVDCRKRGRTAAWAISRMARGEGEIGMFVGSHRYLGQELGEISFRSYFRENAPGFRVLETQINLEDAQLSHEATLELLQRHPNLVGIYAGGGGVAGIVRALREEGGHRKIVTVCNELTPDHRVALIDGVLDLVLHTPLAALAAKLVAEMLAELAPGNRSQCGRQVIVPIEICTAENI